MNFFSIFDSLDEAREQKTHDQLQNTESSIYLAFYTRQFEIITLSNRLVLSD